MIKYKLKELASFSVTGLELALTNQKSKNLERSLSFWPRFNYQLKSNGSVSYTHLTLPTKLAV